MKILANAVPLLQQNFTVEILHTSTCYDIISAFRMDVKSHKKMVYLVVVREKIRLDLPWSKVVKLPSL